ncbi:hypothetical protein ACFZDJ_51005 [Streptomyces sp. NPDC007896]
MLALGALAQPFILHAIPESAVGAFAENSLLQVLVLACLVGAALLGPPP